MLNPAPERAAGVSTPEPGAFRTTLDEVRRSVASGRERGNDAAPAQESPSPVTKTRDEVRCRSEESGISESRDREDPRHDERDDVIDASTGYDRDEPTSITTEPADAASVDAETATESTPTASPDGFVADLPAAILDGPDAGVTAAGSTVPADLATPAVVDSMASGGALSVNLGTAIEEGVGTSAPASAPNTDSTDDARPSTTPNAVPATGQPPVDAAEDAGPIAAATTPGVPVANVDAVAASDVADIGRSTRTASALPEGFTPVGGATTTTAAPVRSEAPAAATMVSAAATTTSVTPARPSSADEARRAGAKTPAAVARADEVNRTIAAGRAGDAGPSSETIATEAVTPIRAADLSNRLARPTAQALPMPGAESAPQTLDEGASRTMPGVGRGLDALARQKGGSLVMRLDPPSLGQLRLQMQMQGGRVTVLMTAASETARSLLHDNLGSLRQALEDRGLAVDRLAVETAGRTSESSSNARSENRGDGQDARGGQNASDRQDAGDGRSRGRRDDASRRHAGRGDGSGRPEAVEFGEVLAGAGVSAT